MLTVSLILLFSLLIGVSQVLRRRRQEGVAGVAAGVPMVVGGIGIVGALCLGAFIGLMIATAGGALFPQIVRVADPFVCDGTASIESSRYSYKPGQRGVQHIITCDTGDGSAPRDITLRSVAMSAVIYGAVAAAVLLILVLGLGQLLSRWLRRSSGKRPGLAGKEGAGTGVEALQALLRAANQDNNDKKLSTYAASWGNRNAPSGATLAALQALLQNTGHVVVGPVSSTTSVSTGSGDPADPATRLLALIALHEQGLLTADEYEVKRAEILSRL